MSVLHPFSLAEYYSILWIDDILLVRLSVDGHLDCFHFSVNVISALINICVSVFSSFGYTPKSGIASSYIVILF